MTKNPPCGGFLLFRLRVRQLFAPLSAARLQNSASALACHAFPETMTPRALALFRLIGAFRGHNERKYTRHVKFCQNMQKTGALNRA